MRRFKLLTALTLVLAACDGGGSGGGGRGGAGGKAGGGGAAGGGAAGRGGTGGGAGNNHGGAGGAGGAGGMAVGGAAGGGAPGTGGTGGSAGATGGSAGGAAGGGASGTGGKGGSAGGTGGSAGAGGVSVAGTAGGGASGASGAAGFGGAAGARQLDGGGTIQSLALSTEDLVADPTRSVLYATTNAGPDAGTVLTIDPVSATVTGSLPVGGIAGLLAISDDGSALYVGIHTPAGPPTPFPGMDGGDTIRRIELASMTAGPSVSLGSSGSNPLSKLGSGQIVAVPGSSTQYMVSRRQPGSQPDYAGLALYDGTTLLAQLDSFFGGADHIAFIDRSTLVGCSNFQSPSELNRFSVTPTAITPGAYVRDVIDGGGETRIAFGSGWIFASDGHALNATTLAPLGRYGGAVIAGFSVGAPIPDPDGANVWFLSADATGMVLLSFDRTTFQMRRTISLGSLTDLSNLSVLVRWSPTGFAFRAFETLYLIKLPN